MSKKFTIEETKEIFYHLCRAGLGEGSRCRQPIFFAQAILGEKYGSFHPFITHRPTDSKATKAKRRKTKKEVIKVLDDYKVPYTFTKHGTLYVTTIETANNRKEILTEALNPKKSIINHAILGIACGFPLEDIFKFLKTTEQKCSRSELDELVQMYFPNYKPWDELGTPLPKKVIGSLKNPSRFLSKLESLMLFSCYNKKRNKKIKMIYANTIYSLLGAEVMEEYIINGYV